MGQEKAWKKEKDTKLTWVRTKILKGKANTGLWAPASHKFVVTSMKHQAGVARDERKGMGVEVAEHGVTLPATQDANAICVHSTEEEGHGTA